MSVLPTTMISTCYWGKSLGIKMTTLRRGHVLCESMGWWIFRRVFSFGIPHTHTFAAWGLVNLWLFTDTNQVILQSTLPSPPLMWIRIICYPKPSVKANLLCPRLGAAGIFTAGKLPEAVLLQRARGPLPFPSYAPACGLRKPVLERGVQTKTPRWGSFILSTGPYTTTTASQKLSSLLLTAIWN